jgi:hypothetical protein
MEKSVQKGQVRLIWTAVEICHVADDGRPLARRFSHSLHRLFASVELVIVRADKKLPLM